ncbi:sigma-70 family RNA polymerase sigma factor [Mesorhizobium australicum]|uniref:sigma-70 family RNA polymerase sigma factor n=1 Tax=Mesorhizobium australicum TaxID=536018 RepID=UPI003336FAB6
MKNSGAPDAPDDLVPLTRKKKDGTTYYRRPALEAEIRRALLRPMQELVPGSAPVSNECLLYFLRNFQPNGGRSPTYEAILLEFLKRVDQRAIKRTGGIHSDRRTEIRGDLRVWFIDKIANHSDLLDVFEFAFNRAIKGKIIDAIRRYQTRDSIEIPASAFSSGDEDGEDDGSEAIAARSNLHRRTHAETMLELRDALDQLSDKERRALVATEYLKVDQKEAGRMVGVSARRIRQLLESAYDKLDAMKKGAEK